MYGNVQLLRLRFAVVADRCGGDAVIGVEDTCGGCFVSCLFQHKRNCEKSLSIGAHNAFDGRAGRTTHIGILGDGVAHQGVCHGLKGGGLHHSLHLQRVAPGVDSGDGLEGEGEGLSLVGGNGDVCRPFGRDF